VSFGVLLLTTVLLMIVAAQELMEHNMEVYQEFDRRAERGEDLSKSTLPTVGSSLQLSRTYTRIAGSNGRLDDGGGLGVLPEFEVASDGRSSPEDYGEAEAVDPELEE
jgi:hypothetical protein